MKIDKEDFYPVFTMSAFGLLILIPAMIVMGIFVLFPLAIICAAVAFIRWQRRQPIPTPVLHDAIAPVFPDEDTFVTHVINGIMAFETYPRYPLLEAMVQAAVALYDIEALQIRPILLHPKGSVEEARYRDTLIAFHRKAADPARTLEIFLRTLCTAFADFTAKLPKLATTDTLETEDTCLFHVKLDELVASKAPLISAISFPFFDPVAVELSVFATLRKQLRNNEVNASVGSKSIFEPQHYKKGDIVEAYLGGTPLEPLFEKPIPWELPEETRFSGHWIIAPQGKGKTTLLTSMLKSDFDRDAAVIIIDGKGDLIDEVGNLKSLQNRYVIFDPRSTAINPLNVEHTNVQQAAEQLEYIFSALLEAQITPLQSVVFRAVFRALVTAFPNPTVATLHDLLLNGYEPYRQYIDTLPEDLRDFFYKQYDSYRARRQEILARVDLLLSNEHIRTMLLQPAEPFSIGEAMDAGKVILINNSVKLLGQQGSEFIGRYFLSEIWAAATARSGRDYKKPCYVYIDEAHRIIHRDEKVRDIIDECRSQKIALILAHQRADQISLSGVMTALGNCAIRYANSDEEARILAPKMRATPAFLQSLKVGEFAAFVRDVTTEEAVTITVTRADFRSLEKIPAQIAAPVQPPPVIPTAVTAASDSWDNP